MNGAIAALFSHPIKGFTPQKVASAQLTMGEPFPGDRLFAVEDGPSGFDPAAPAWVRKQKFTVLANIAEVAKAHTQYDLTTGRLTARWSGAPDFEGNLHEGVDQARFCDWLAARLGAEASGPLRMMQSPGHQFLDHPQGHVSIVNLASVRDLAARLGKPVDPLRFRANLYVEGWDAWAENGWTGAGIRLGQARTRVFAPIVRCAAPDVDPATAERDIEITAELHRLYGHVLCGIYVHVIEDGTIAEGDQATLESDD